MNKFYKQKNSGFTIIEAMIAVFILTVSIASMLGLTSSSISTAKYTSNEIIANYLLQEAIDSIRNTRDTLVFQGSNNSTDWTTFLNKYGDKDSKTMCFSDNGCIIDVNDFNGSPSLLVVEGCGSGGCKNINYVDRNGDDYGSFYNYDDGVLSRFNRTIKMSMVSGYNNNQVKVEAIVSYTNGSAGNKKTMSLITYLLNWQND